MWNKIMDVKARVSSNEGTLFSYAFAYSLIVGLAPLIIIAVVFIANFVFSVEQIISVLSRFIPADLIVPFINYISISDTSNLLLVIPLISVSIWVASKSFYSFLLLASEDDGLKLPKMLLRVLSVFYFVIFVVALLAVGFLVSFVPFSTELILPGILFIFFLFFYRILSFNQISLLQLFYGAGFSSIALMLVGQFFFFYINSFTNYENIYGPLASFMILLISAWVISWVIFVGYCINIVFGKTQEGDVLPVFSRFNRK